VGEWLTVGAVVLGWLAAVVVVVAIRLVRAHKAVNETAAALEAALRRRHELSMELAYLLAGHGVLTAIGDLVSDARAVTGSLESTWSVRQAIAERGLEVVLHDICDHLDHDRPLRRDEDIADVRLAVESVHAEIANLDLEYDALVSGLSKQRSGWPGRWIAQWLRLRQ
jgi:hypothetical protein